MRSIFSVFLKVHVYTLNSINFSLRQNHETILTKIIDELAMATHSDTSANVTAQ